METIHELKQERLEVEVSSNADKHEIIEMLSQKEEIIYRGDSVAGASQKEEGQEDRCNPRCLKRK